ncbi:hypothetical protein P692DRAFT_20887822, partial [Suillus brevipes Sb2]
KVCGRDYICLHNWNPPQACRHERQCTTVVQDGNDCLPSTTSMTKRNLTRSKSIVRALSTVVACFSQLFILSLIYREYNAEIWSTTLQKPIIEEHPLWHPGAPASNITSQFLFFVLSSPVRLFSPGAFPLLFIHASRIIFHLRHEYRDM